MIEKVCRIIKKVKEYIERKQKRATEELQLSKAEASVEKEQPVSKAAGLSVIKEESENDEAEEAEIVEVAEVAEVVEVVRPE